jgi:hypothetical protein
MRDRHERSFSADLVELTRRAAVELQLRRPAMAHDFHVAPQNAVRVPRAERLHGRFLGGKAAGEVNCWIVAPRAVRDLAGCEDPREKPVAVSLDGRGDPFDVGCVEADADDVRSHNGGHAATA